ncbi:MAG: gliding motility lipoprotein GldH [Bacteroidales bacterium]|nr:gliding motility lipoprotein GldH [Bacteroidales bacterium]
MIKKLFYCILCVAFASCQSPKQTVMEQSVAVDNNITQTFVYANDNEQVPYNVYLTIAHNNRIDFNQLVLTFSHSFNDKETFAIPIGIPLIDRQGNFLGTQKDSVWYYEVAVLKDTYMQKGEQLFAFISDDGRIIHGVETIGIRIEK